MSTNDCYQVKVHATMTNDLKCLYEKLGTGMFEIIALLDHDISPLLADPQILEVEFDKCDTSKVTFTVYVELPRVTLDGIDFDPVDGQNDVRVLPVEYTIRTKGHLHTLELVTFTVYPLAYDGVYQSPPVHTGAVTSAGYETECYSHEQCRIQCANECDIPAPDSFRVVFPMNRDVACLIPEFGLNGFYLKNLVSANLKTKVRLVSGNNPNAVIAAALLSYDPERCEACLEFSEADAGEIVTGYEYLFTADSIGMTSVSVRTYNQPSLSEMATNRRYNVRGVSKCTEKDLFTFEICFKPSLVSTICQRQPVMNYGIDAISTEHWCYQFENSIENTP
jgi:hypothetical protein